MQILSPRSPCVVVSWAHHSVRYLALLVLGGSLFGTVAHAQPHLPSAPPPNEVPVSDTAEAEWDYQLQGRLSASQAAYKDWQEGGVNSFSFTTALDGAAERKGEHWAQAHNLRLVLGFVNQEGQESRKSDDLIHLNSALRYQGKNLFRLFHPTIALDVRTQFAAGFRYSENPYPEGHPRDGDELPVQTSAFLAPGTITESVGLTYKPVEQYSLRLGLASKQTIVLEPDFRVLYDVDPNQAVRVEAGAQLASDLDAQLSENIRYRNRLNAFLSVNQLENPPDIVWENLLELRVNSWLTTNVEFVAMYDENTTRALQLKEVISLGVSVSFL